LPTILQMSVLQLFQGGWERLWTLPTTTTDLSGRTVIVTGANVGLGFEAAKAMYAMNPSRLIIAVRSLQKGEEAKKAILESTKKHAPPGQDRGETRLEVWELDLASFDSVKRFAQRCVQEFDRLDVLLENAAMATGQWVVTDDGWESTIQVNVISTFMLATLLMPLVEKTAKLPALNQGDHLKPHLVIISSDAHITATLPQKSQSHILNALNDKAQFAVMDRYPASKLLEVLLTRELAHNAIFQNGDVVLSSVNPGFCRSELMRELPLAVRWMLYNLFARTTAEGAKTLLWASLENKIPPGSYSSSCAVVPPSKFVLSKEGARVQKKIWQEIGDVIVKSAPETTAIWKA